MIQWFSNSFRDYQRHAKWFSENCTDPKLLFESVVYKPNQLIKSLKFSYFDKKETDEITDFQNTTSKIWKVIDDHIYGRCIQATPTIEMIQFGIRRLELKFNTSVILLFHTIGDFKTGRSAKTKTEPEFGSYIRLDLEHEVFDLLDIEGKPCNSGEINFT